MLALAYELLNGPTSTCVVPRETKALASFVAADPTRAKEVSQLHRGLSVKLNLTPGEEFTSWDFTSTSQDGSQGF